MTVVMNIINNFKIYFPLALFFALAIAWIIIVYKVGDWPDWKKYYPTILFFWCGDLIYNVIFYEKPLWVFVNPALTHHLTDIICAFVIFTGTVLIYIPMFPTRFRYKILYVGFWVLLYSSIEWIFNVLGGISYQNGWNIWWSVIHNIYQFILLKIHQDRPILAWILAIAILILIANIYSVHLVGHG